MQPQSPSKEWLRAFLSSKDLFALLDPFQSEHWALLTMIHSNYLKTCLNYPQWCQHFFHPCLLLMFWFAIAAKHDIFGWRFRVTFSGFHARRKQLLDNWASPGMLLKWRMWLPCGTPKPSRTGLNEETTIGNAIYGPHVSCHLHSLDMLGVIWHLASSGLFVAGFLQLRYRNFAVKGDTGQSTNTVIYKQKTQTLHGLPKATRKRG